jgi:hypothetical protein
MPRVEGGKRHVAELYTQEGPLVQGGIPTEGTQSDERDKDGRKSST